MVIKLFNGVDLVKKNNIYFGKINIKEDGTIKIYQSASPLLSLGYGNYVNEVLTTQMMEQQ